MNFFCSQDSSHSQTTKGNDLQYTFSSLIYYYVAARRSLIDGQMILIFYSN